MAACPIPPLVTMSNGSRRPLLFNTPHHSLKVEFGQRVLELAAATTAALPLVQSTHLLDSLRFPTHCSARWLPAPSNPFRTEVIGPCPCCPPGTALGERAQPEFGLVVCLGSDARDGVVSSVVSECLHLDCGVLPPGLDQSKIGRDASDPAKRRGAGATTTLHLALALVALYGSASDSTPAEGVFTHPLLRAWLSEVGSLTLPLISNRELWADGYIYAPTAVERQTDALDAAYCASLSAMLAHAARQWVAPPVVRDEHSKLLGNFTDMRLDFMRSRTTPDAALPLCAMAHDILAASGLVAFALLEHELRQYAARADASAALCYADAHEWFEELRDQMQRTSLWSMESQTTSTASPMQEIACDVPLVPSVREAFSSPGSWMVVGDLGGGRVTSTLCVNTPGTSRDASLASGLLRKRLRDPESDRDEYVPDQACFGNTRYKRQCIEELPM